MGDVVPLPVHREPPQHSPQHTPQHTPQHSPQTRPGPEELWRESVGRELREERQAQGKRLVDAAEAAGVSPQYLSEVERGLKDPSSELLAAMAGALGLSVGALATRVGSTAPQSPVCLAA